jgi:hypothetical protein
MVTDRLGRLFRKGAQSVQAEIVCALGKRPGDVKCQRSNAPKRKTTTVPGQGQGGLNRHVGETIKDKASAMSRQ